MLTSQQNNDWNIYNILIEDYERAIASYAKKFREIIHNENNMSNTLACYFPVSYILGLSSDKDIITNIWTLSFIVSENRKKQDFVPEEILRLFGILGPFIEHSWFRLGMIEQDLINMEAKKPNTYNLF